MFVHRAPADMIHTSAKTQMALKKDYDEFGDSYMQDTTPDQLKYTFQHMDNVGFNSSIGYWFRKEEYSYLYGVFFIANVQVLVFNILSWWVNITVLFCKHCIVSIVEWNIHFNRWNGWIGREIFPWWFSIWIVQNMQVIIWNVFKKWVNNQNQIL